MPQLKQHSPQGQPASRGRRRLPRQHDARHGDRRAHTSAAPRQCHRRTLRPGGAPIAVRLVHEVYRKFAKSSGTPIVGIGGVLTWEDAAEFILAGASAVEMGTGLFVDPRSPAKVVRGLEKWARDQGTPNISDLVGAVAL